MSRPPRTVIEYRNYELPADFPIQMLSGENWRISDVPSGVLHFHNCLEIGLCESDGGFLGFRGEQRAFRAGDVTIISGDVPHTTWSDPGTASKWSYLHLDPFELVRPLFPAEALPNGELLQQAVQGHYYILSPQEYPAVQSLVRSMLAEMQQRQMDYAISVLWPQRGGAEPLSLLLLAVVYGGIFTAMLFVENRRPGPAGKLKITPAGTFVAVVMALTAFAVSNLSFANGSEANMNMFYIRTLVDLAGALILTVQHEQLREAALHSELAELDGVLHRQYEQYKQSKENIRLINRRYHELKMQIAAIRAERDHAKQDVALAAMESGIRQYEAENKTGNPVLDTLLTAKSLYCQQHHITMTCVADGHLLDFLETGEICTIVGTALDNATESVETEPDHEKRLIRVAVYAQNGFVMLRFENYCAQEVELGADGLPRRNTHGGSDLRSVRAAAEKRGGTMTLHWENGWFTLRVLLPQKK